MSLRQLRAVAGLVTEERDTLIGRWRDEVQKLPAAEGLDEPTLIDHLPAVLDDLTRSLRSGSDDTIVGAHEDGPVSIHGIERLRQNFDIEEVVAEYNVLRTTIHDLAEEHGLTLQGEPFRILNRVLDKAIGAAVKTYAHRRAEEVRREREDYLAFVAHDLRGPLQSLSTAIAVLELTLGEEARQPEMGRLLQAFRQNIGTLAELATMVLQGSTHLEDPAERERVVPREIALSGFVEAIFHGFDPVARAGNTNLRNEVPEDLRVQADPRLLGRAFQNLIVNALTHARGEEVAVGAREEPDGSVECWVRDTGMGMSKDTLAAIFDTDREGHSGMGLAIVRRFVEAHGGTISVDSEESQGATFRFTLPSG